MREQLVEVSQCKAGDRVAREVIDIRSGVVLCAKGHELTDEGIQWLKKFMCSDIYIEVEEWNKVWNLSEESTKKYENSKKKLSITLESLRLSRTIDTQEIDEIKEDVRDLLKSNSTIMGCVNIVKNVDEYTYSHSMNVGMLAALIGKWLKLSEQQIEELFLAGLLHDAGKYKINPNIINKKGPLTKDEFSAIKKHVIKGYELAKSIDLVPNAVMQGIIGHHERIDGSGYPRELKGDEIHLFGKIVAIADVYDARISARCYKPRETPFEVMEAMYNEEVDKLDTNILLTFLKNIANYYIGVYVKLSTGAVGEVVFIHPHCVYRPIVNIGSTYIDLDTQRDIRIVDVV